LQQNQHSILLQNPNWMKMHYQKGHQNILAENENRLYAILERGFPGTFSSFLKSGGFCSRINI